MIGTDKRCQLPAAAFGRQVVAHPGSHGPSLAIGVTLFTTVVDAKCEGALEVVVVQTTRAQRGIGPPAVLPELGEGAGQVAVELVVRVLFTGLQLLPVYATGKAQAPGVVETVTAAQGQVVAVSVSAGSTALVIEVQVLATGADESLPLADGLPG